MLQEALLYRTVCVLRDLREAIAAAEGPADVCTLVEIIDTLQPHGRTLYILSSELALHRIRNPESPLDVEDDFVWLKREIAEIVGSVLGQLGRRPTIELERIADMLVLFFFDSVFDEAVLPKGAERKKRAFPEMADITIQAFSEPIE